MAEWILFKEVISFALMLLSWAFQLACGIYTLFAGYIDLCNFALITFVTWLVCNQGLHWHTVFGLLLGVVLGGLSYWAFKTKVGFWIVSTFFSALWTWTFVELILKMLFSVEMDKIWYWTVVILSFVFFMGSHNYANWRERLKAKKEAKQRAYQESLRY